jgi:uncharacterized protein (TIGR02118 family)
MIKYVNVLVREEGWSHEEFLERWTGDHADLAADLPGLQKYATSVPRDPERAGADGIVELYFEDADALAAAFDSEVGQAVQDDADEFVDQDRSRQYVVEETIRFDGTA